MKHRYKSALLMVIAALALSAGSASSALAAPEWYSSATKPAPEWWQGGAKLSGATATKWKGRVVLEDTGAQWAVQCESSGEGSASPGVLAKDTSWTLSGCTPTEHAYNKKGEVVANLCEKVEAVGTRILPEPLSWLTELTLSKGRLLATISSEHSGVHPGFQIRCKAQIGTLSDGCLTTESQITVPVANVSGGVEATFGNEKLYKCAIGGKEAGVMRTGQVIEAAKGGKLETHIVEGSYSKLTSAVAVTGTGELTVEDNVSGFGPMGTACPMQWKGTIEAGGKGKITSTYAVCTPVGSCGTLRRAESIGTPWVTELSESGGTIRDKIVSGAESPEWLFVCEKSGWSGTDRCGATVSPETTNGLEGNVLALFSAQLTKTSCKLGTGGESGTWKGELTLAPSSGAIAAKK